MTDERSAKLLRALQFFDGKLVVRRREGSSYVNDFEGLAGVEELTPEEEEDARRCIAELLLSPEPPNVLLERLAGLFSPDNAPTAADRRAELVYRKSNRPRNPIIAAQLALDVQAHRERGLSREAAIEEVATKHGLSPTTVKSTIERWPDITRRLREQTPHK